MQGTSRQARIRYAVARSVRPNIAFYRPERSFGTFVISVTNSPFPDFHHREESFSNGATGLIQDHNGVMQGTARLARIRYAVAQSVRPNFAFYRPERSFVTFAITVTNSPFPDFYHREESFSNIATGVIQDHDGVMQGTARLAQMRYAVARSVRPNVAFYRPESSFVTFAISVTNSPFPDFHHREESFSNGATGLI